MALQRVKTFTNGGTLTPDDLNDIQDAYLEQFEIGESEWIGHGPIASRPAPAAVPGRGWLDTDGTEWRSTGDRWLPVGGRLPFARLQLYNGGYATNGPLWFDIHATDRLTYDHSAEKLNVPIAGRYYVALTLALTTSLYYMANDLDTSLIITGQTPNRVLRLNPMPFNQYGGGDYVLCFQTTVDLAPAAAGTPATVQVTTTSSNSDHVVNFAELCVALLGA